MLTTLLTATLLSAALAQETDTTFAVNPEARLDVHLLGGEVVVRTWDRNEVRVRAEHASRDRIDINATRRVVRIRTRTRRGTPRAVDFTITIPASMAVEVSGTWVDADLAGVRGEVKVETVQGDVRLRGGGRYVTLSSVQGEVDVEGARGRIGVGSVNGDVRVVDIVGSLTAETVNGEVTVLQAQCDAVEVSTMNGDVVYDGTITGDGRYIFGTHNGDVTVFVPSGTNAAVSVSTFNGEFDSAFPVTLTETRGGGKRFRFVLGDGGARIELHTFGGTIRLRRPSGRR